MSKQKLSCLSTIVLGTALGLGAVFYLNNNPLKNESRYEARGESSPNYVNFRFPNELETIAFHANRVGAELPLLLAIREAENGRNGLQFGVIPNSKYNADSGFTYNNVLHPYPNDNELSKQASWASHTIRNNLERFNALPDEKRRAYIDFIDFLGDRYAPVKAKNDPNNLNSNWERNGGYKR